MKKAKPEQNTLPRRLRRYAKVSKAAAKIGARAAGNKLGLKQSRQHQAEMLRKALGGLKGPLMKVAQFLASLPDIIPPEYAAELMQLQADAPPMGWAFVKRRMAEELGPNWEKKFKSFEREAAHAASLGQVHRATGLDGKKLACKLRYPDMASVVEADLRQLKLGLAIFHHFDKTLETSGIHAEIADRMREELDYEREARHIRLYRAIFRKKIPLPLREGLGEGESDWDESPNNIHIPEVIEKLSTPRLLTMTWLDGERLTGAAKARGLKDRNAIAKNMFRAWYRPFYSYGVIHGDPHLGNYTVRKDNSINLLDFGCIRVFRPELVQGVIWLHEALAENKPSLAVEAYKAWGFKNPSKQLIDVLNIWARFIYAPLLKDKTQLMEETNTGSYGRETAFRVHRELRKIGGVSIPREFVFIDRASIGLGAVFLRLRAKINWYRLFHEMTNDFDLKELTTRQRKLLKEQTLH